MTPETRPTPARAAPLHIDYRKLTVVLMAVVLFATVINDWDDFKSGFLGAYHKVTGR